MTIIQINNALCYTSNEYDFRLFNAILIVLQELKHKDINTVFLSLNTLLKESDNNKTFICGSGNSHIWIKEELNSENDNLITILF